MTEKLPALKRRGGLTTWKAAVGRDTDIYETYDEFYASPKSTAAMKEKIPKTFWPAGNGAEQGLEKWSVLMLRSVQIVSLCVYASHMSLPSLASSFLDTLPLPPWSSQSEDVPSGQRHRRVLRDCPRKGSDSRCVFRFHPCSRRERTKDRAGANVSPLTLGCLDCSLLGDVDYG